MVARKIVLSLVWLSLYRELQAQDEFKSNFIGINPSVTVEPFYEKGELDVNIVPIVYQRPLARRLDLRLTSICNLGIRNAGSEISHLGLELGFPIFFVRKEDKRVSSKGFFAAPVVSLTRNRIAEHNNLGLWIEPGYHLLFDNSVAMSFGLQVGTTYFSYDDGQNKWGGHFGVKVILGKWF